MHKVVKRFPLQFRVLFRQFLLRVIDLEALSIKADVVGLLGQFSGVLIMLSILGAAFAYNFIPKAPWHFEQYLISTMMLVVGLIAVVSWDATFPDRRDVMVLAPLPVAPSTILSAKIAATATLLGLAVLTLNCASGIICPLRLAHSSNWGFFQSFAAYWVTMILASLFLYCAVLTVQGFTALLLPRRLFLRLSAILQLAAFILFVGTYFLQPSIATPMAMESAGNHLALVCSPTFWFFALFNQLNGSLPSNLAWLAWRAWIGLGIVVSGAAASLLLCYLRTMKKTVEEPDLVPGARGSKWPLRFGNPLQTAITLFSIRSLTRSRHHRVAFSFYLALVLALAFSLLKSAMSAAAPHPLTVDFLTSTFIMMCLAVVGLRSVFSLPISLNANWIFRIAQVRPSEDYVATTRRSLLLFAVVPVCAGSALLSVFFSPWHQAWGHVAVLALFGSIVADLSLIGFYKVPFTCSYLPGKSNIQFLFWGFLIVFVPLAMSAATYEQAALHNLFQFICWICGLVAIAGGVWLFNRHQARSAVLYFEELPPDLITTLGLVSVRLPETKSCVDSLASGRASSSPTTR